ncbi:MAG: hypothetical protein JWM10_3031 [Myxococcaceae bacterium]|nr:hypothetical protein [Myxococcaceae bacterium]
MSTDGEPVVVVVATRRGREEMLLGRALPSIFRQVDVRPRALVVVDDDATGTSPLGAAIVALARRQGWQGREVAVVPNRRTRGFSGTGAWNTGAGEARGRLPLGGWLAFLDDDDAWRETYLARCVAAAREGNAALVVSGLLRVGAEVEPQLAPVGLTAATFFETNPGIQSSNLFIALDLFESVGGFDESLPSTTDRDLLIRVFDHLERRPRPVARVEEYLVEHHAHAGPRVTTDARAKHLGLDRFYARYGARMDAATLGRSLARAERLFGYRADRC